MKNLKKRLMAATAMLVISAVMLTSVSYAWFTLSTNPEMSNMTAMVAANENLEIALDNGYADEAAVDAASVYDTTTGAQGSTAGNPYTWGNYVDLTKAFTDLNAGNALVLQPVKYIAGGIAETANNDTTSIVRFSYPQYDVDGRVNQLGQLLSSIFTAKEGLEALGGIKAYSKVGGAATYYAFSATYWLRSNVTGEVYLQTADRLRAGDELTATSEVTDVNGVMGEGSYIKIPASVYGPIRYNVTTTGGGTDAVTTYTPVYTEEQQAINNYLSNLVIRFEDTTGSRTETTASFVVPEGIGEFIYPTLGVTTGLVDNDVVHPAPKAGLATSITELKKSDGTSLGYYINGIVENDEVVAKTTNAEDLYIYLENTKTSVEVTPADETAETPAEYGWDKTPITSLTANVARKINMYVYIDGETITNADALLKDITGLKFNIQFAHEKIDGVGTTTGSGAITGNSASSTESKYDADGVVKPVTPTP